jgi:2,4-didehydro-3-deoxy-L-rhamnonate hydrolase
MKLVRIGAAGQERPAVLLDEMTALDVSSQFAEYDGEFFASGGIDRLRALVDDPAADSLPRVAVDGVRLGAPIARPHAVLCIGLNYEDHALEAGMPIPEEPVLFTKTPNTVVGPTDDIELPRGSERTDWEVELAVVIGRECRYLEDEEEAMQAIVGYCVANDVSERSFQIERGGQWSKGKSCATFNPLGPWLVTPDEIPDVGDLALGLDVNGERMQTGSTSRMVFSVAHIVRYLSQFLVLEPGDIVNTGTPPGVGMGMEPPRYLQEGDLVEAWIEGLGRQRSTVVGPR